MKYSKVLLVLVVCFIVGILFIFGVNLQGGNLAKMENVAVDLKASEAQLKQEVKAYQKRKHIFSRESNSDKSNDNSGFYQSIVDNNLFRPLGWKPPNEEPEYTLIGTAIAAIGTKSEAFVVERRSNQFYVVSVGDEIGDAVVKEIEDKTITLDINGEMITFNTGNMEFLKSVDRSSQANSSSQYERNSESDRNNQRSSRSKSTNIEDQKKRIAKMMKESDKQMKSLMKDVAKVERDIKKEEQKMLIQKKKVIATDLKLKTSSGK